MWCVIAKVRIFEGREADWERIFADRRRHVLATEPGTIVYDLLRSKADASVYFAVERFVSEEAYHAHREGSQGHEEMLACIEGDPEIEYLDLVDGCA